MGFIGLLLAVDHLQRKDEPLAQRCFAARGQFERREVLRVGPVEQGVGSPAGPPTQTMAIWTRVLAVGSPCSSCSRILSPRFSSSIRIVPLAFWVCMEPDASRTRMHGVRWFGFSNRKERLLIGGHDCLPAMAREC